MRASTCSQKGETSKRRSRFGVVAGLVVVTTVAMSSPAVAQDVVVEEFTEPPAGWAVDWSEGGEWFFDGGFLIGEGHAWYSYVQHDWDDLTVEFSVSLNGPLHINLRSGESRYRFAILQDEFGTAIELWRDSPESTPRDLPIVSDGSSFGGADDPQDFFDVMVSVKGDYLEMRVADMLIGWQDPDPLPPGRFGFESLLGTGYVQIDRVRLSGTVPGPAPVPPPTLGRVDVALLDLMVEPLAPDRLHLDVVLANFGDAPTEGGVLLAEFNGDPLLEMPLEGGLGPDDTRQLEFDGVVPARWIGTSGVVTAWVELEGDSDFDNNWAETEVVLPAVSQPPTTRPPSTTPPSTISPPAQPGRDDRGREGGTGWIWGVVGGSVVALGGLGALRGSRLRRLPRQAAAQDAIRHGRCQAGVDEYTHREFKPDLKLRKITSIGLAQPSPPTRHAPIATKADDPRLIRLLNQALMADRLNRAEREDRFIHEATERLVDEVQRWTGAGRVEGLVELSVEYEGAEETATFSTWRCTADGIWPDPESKPRHRWKAKVKDGGLFAAGRFELDQPLDSQKLMADLAVLLAAAVDGVSERRHLAPPAIEVGLNPEL